jgi:hypothetical protein
MELSILNTIWEVLGPDVHQASQRDNIVRNIRVYTEIYMVHACVN